jgi:hypothetical protein
MSNIKQLALSMHIYAVDHEDRLPLEPDWGEAVYPYVKNWDIYSPPQNWFDGLTYSMNRQLAGADLQAIPEPHETPLLFMSTLLEPGRLGAIRDIAYDEEGHTFLAMVNTSARRVDRAQIADLVWRPKFSFQVTEVEGDPLMRDLQ